MGQRSVDREVQVPEVERFGDEVESPSVHCRADVLHVVISRNDDGRDVGVDLVYPSEQRESVHLGHVDIRDHHVDVLVLVQSFECVQAVLREEKRIMAGSNVASHPLQHERLEIRLVVNHENFVWVLHQPCSLLWDPGMVFIPTVQVPDACEKDGPDQFLSAAMASVCEA